VQEPEGTEDVTRVDGGADVVVTGLLVETATTDVGGAEVKGLTVDDTGAAEELTPPVEPQPNWRLDSCHVVVVLEKVDQTKAVTALALAPEKLLKGMLMVCVDPVRPLMATNVEVYVVAVQDVWVWISSVSEPPAGPLRLN